MNVKIKEKWLAALRSGEYKQGQDALRSGDKYCCLGVLSDLYQEDHEDCVWKRTENGQTLSLTGANSQDLPVQVATWAGIRRPVMVSSQGRDIRVAELNDGGHSFAELADLIEESL